jgi:hypothetical protein
VNEEYSSGRPFREFADGASKQAADDFRFGSIGRGVRDLSPLRTFKEWQMPLRLQIGWYRGVFRPRGFLGLENFFVFMILLQKPPRGKELVTLLLTIKNIFLRKEKSND